MRKNLREAKKIIRAVERKHFAKLQEAAANSLYNRVTNRLDQKRDELAKTYLIPSGKN